MGSLFVNIRTVRGAWRWLSGDRMGVVEETRTRLLELAEPEYQAFASGLLPDTGNLLGVRLPKLRGIAKKLAGRDAREYLDAEPGLYFEEVMLRGMIIGYAPFTDEERKQELERFLPAIRDWSVCDSSCITYKFMRENREEWFTFLEKYIADGREFVCRFAVVCILDHFLTDSFIDKILTALGTFHGTGYYDKMGAAWLLSMCYVNYREKTLDFLGSAGLDSFTYQKTLQKICESSLADSRDKAKIRAMKKGVMETWEK